MKKSIAGSAVAIALALTALTPTTALAKDGDVIRRGGCSGSADWKLKLSPENGRIEVEFEVDSNRNGQRWRVRMFRNDRRFTNVVRKTHAPSGSFEVRRVTGNKAGTDRFRARARNIATGQVCVGRAAF